MPGHRLVQVTGFAGARRGRDTLELDQVPLRSQVIINRPWPHISDDGVFDGEHWERQATRLLDDLSWWASALRSARAST